MDEQNGNSSNGSNAEIETWQEITKYIMPLCFSKFLSAKIRAKIGKKEELSE